MGSTFLRCQILVVLLLVFPFTSLQGQYVRVTGSSVNVRDRPALESTVVASAENGDVFTTTGEAGGWYVITMFSGEQRYIHGSMAVPVEKLPTLPASEDVRRLAFEGLLRADDRSHIEADLKIPDSESRAHEELRQVLEDRYKLQAFHGFPTIHPVHFEVIEREGRTKGWDRIGAHPDPPGR